MLPEKTAKLLEKVQCIAIVGAKDVAGQPVDTVGRYLIEAGYTVFPVHPVRQNVWGLPTYKSIADVPSTIDLVNVFRASIHCADLAKECQRLLALPYVFWMQSGIMNPEVHEIFFGSEVKVIENACLMVEHKKMIEAQNSSMVILA